MGTLNAAATHVLYVFFIWNFQLILLPSLIFMLSNQAVIDIFGL